MRKPRQKKPRTAQYVKNSLKFKANEAEDVVTVRVGRNKYTVPGKVRMLNSDGYLFLSFPASTNLFRIQNDELKPMENEEDAQEAYDALRVRRGRGARGAAMAELPEDLAAAFRNIPAGHKVGYDKQGNPRLVKTRTRRTKA